MEQAIRCKADYKKRKEICMSDKMIPVSFSKMLDELLLEYKNSGTLYGVTPYFDAKKIPIGPAAGPHTQLAGNLVSAFAAGANYFELKTVQILEGKELHIVKPCIYVGQEVYNTEWSSELTVEEAKNEYIKAYLLIHVLSREFSLRDCSHLSFVISVGYDLQGIQSTKVDGFINDMTHAKGAMEWKLDLQYLKENLTLFSKLTREDILEIESNDQISDTVTLSTMHGCKKSEIEKIALYLLQEKGLNTYIKMNPTLIGKQEIDHILKSKGYQDMEYSDIIFEKDITLTMALEIIRNCQLAAKNCHRLFGIKLTNTFPVFVKNQELSGTQMYMSGPPLYPIAIKAVQLLAEGCNGDLVISYSGGADEWNMKELLECGISCVTFSSILLKTGGYKNITKLLKKADDYQLSDKINLEKVAKLSEMSLEDAHYNKAPVRNFERKDGYSMLCANCNNCVDVCPNRANRMIMTDSFKGVVHLDHLCNECGSCVFTCIMGHSPYQEKLTVFLEEQEYQNSTQNKVLLSKNKELTTNITDSIITEKIKELIDAGLKTGRISSEL